LKKKPGEKYLGPRKGYTDMVGSQASLQVGNVGGASIISRGEKAITIDEREGRKKLQGCKSMEKKSLHLRGRKKQKKKKPEKIATESKKGRQREKKNKEVGKGFGKRKNTLTVGKKKNRDGWIGASW